MFGKPHKHAEVIKAWADGAQIQMAHPQTLVWEDVKCPMFHDYRQYRVKPEPKPDVDVYLVLCVQHKWRNTSIVVQWTGNPPAGYGHHKPDLKLTFDGETGKLKAAEVL